MWGWGSWGWDNCEQSPSAQARTAAHKHLDRVCRMLSRCPHMSGAHLSVGSPQTPDSYQPPTINPAATALSLEAAQRLGAASGGRITRLSLNGLDGLPPAPLLAAAAACPGLQQLHLELIGLSEATQAGDVPAVAAAARALPTSIHTLNLRLQLIEQLSAPCLQQLAAVLAAATQLNGLHSLEVSVATVGTEHMLGVEVPGEGCTSLDMSMFTPVAAHLTAAAACWACPPCWLHAARTCST